MILLFNRLLKRVATQTLKREMTPNFYNSLTLFANLLKTSSNKKLRTFLLRSANDADLTRIRTYIANNPSQWAIDEENPTNK